MECPRCKVELSIVSTIVEAHLCEQCEGVWLSKEALDRCLELRIEYLRNSPLWVTLEADHPDVALDPLIVCPECSAQMQRYPFREDCEVVVDGCPQHGIWLDDGELAKVHEFKGSHSSAPCKGRERVEAVSSGMWHKLACWFQQLRPASSG